MAENIAAANVSRTFTLSGTNIAIFTFMLFFLYPKYENGGINPFLFQATLTAMSIGVFSFVFASLRYYRCSLSGGIGETDERSDCRADRLWMLGYTVMFLTPGLVLFLIGLLAVASVWLGLWSVCVFFVIRYFPNAELKRKSVHV